MVKNKFRNSTRKAVLAASLCALFPATVLSDIYTWGAITGPANDPATCSASPDAAEVVFTMIQGNGAVNKNSSSSDFGGYHTNTCGVFVYDSSSGIGSMEIVGFNFAGNLAEAKTILINKIPSALAKGNDTYLLANMLFDWNANNGIPVSIVYDAQGILGEIDTPTSFTLLDDGNGTGNSDATSSVSITQTVSSPFADTGATPASDGTLADFGPFGIFPLAQGPKPLAGTIYDTDKIVGVDSNGDEVCVIGVDAVFTAGGTPRLNEGGGCMGINPSADIALEIVADTFDNTVNNPTNPVGKSGDPMIDGPFGNFNANFSFDNMKLVSFVDTTPPTLSLNAHVSPAGTSSLTLTVGVDTYTEPGATCTDAAPLGTNLDTDVVIGGDIVNTATAGTYIVTYNCADGSGNDATQVTRTVVVNTPPEANPNYDQTLASNSTLDIDFTTTDLTGGNPIATDDDGDTMTFSAVGTTTNGGNVTGNGTDTLTYTPLSGYNGPDSFTFTVNDGYIDSGSGTVNLNVTNVLPVAVSDGSSAVINTPVDIDLVANDTDYEDDINAVALSTVTIIDSPAAGSLGAPVGGTVTYTAPATIPATNPVTFTYTVTDSDGGVSTPKTTVSVTILSAPNAAPVANDFSDNTDAGTPLNIDITSVATDADGDTLIFTNVSTAANGIITGQNTSTLAYTPDPGYNGPDSFTFTANDGKGGVSLVKTVSITVNQVAPVANDDPGYTMLLGDTLNIDVAANDSDVEDDANATALVTVSPGTPDNGGTAVAVSPADGTIDFTPTTVGTETFTYTVADSDTNVSAPATVTVTVTAAPVAEDVVGLSTNEDTPLTTISLPDPAIATDADGDALTFDSFSQGTNGTVAANAGSTALTYTPDTNYNGTDSFSFSVSDGVNSSASKTMTVSVIAVDDPMVCQNASVTTAVDTPKVITTNSLIGTCTDVDGTVTLAGYGQPTNGTVTDDGAGNLTYTPNTGFNGPDSFIFTATDGAGGDTDYSVNVTVSDAAAAAVHIISTSNFTMIDPGGATIGGATDVSGVFDERLICDTVSCQDIAMTTPLASSQPFNANLWTAHHIRVFAPGSYTFDSACSGADITAGTTNCGGGAPLELVVPAGKLGAHMLFDWGVNSDIDVAVLWDYNTSFGASIFDGGCPSNPNCDTTQTATRVWNWVSIDGDGNGKPGIPMVDGPFGGFHANFNLDMISGYTPPVANNDNVGTKPLTLVVIDVIANDVDAEEGAPPTGITVTLSTATSLEGGTLVNNGDGTVDYTPPASLIIGDSDSFQYTLTDAGGAVSEIATVNITITDNTAPTANNVEFTVEEDAVLEISSNDIDITSTTVGDDLDGDPLTFATFDTVSTQGATVAIGNTADMLNYLPLADFNGTDTFNFTLTDGVSDSNVATMTITVNPVNDAVVCADVSLGTDIDTPLVIDATADLLAGCTDVDGDTISFVSADQPTEAGNTVEVNAGTLTYTPATDFEGDDSFTFTATDGNGGSVTATVNIKVGTPFGNFTMLDSAGNVFGGTNDIFFTWDQTTFNTDESDTNFGVMTITSVTPQPFFNFLWTAHHIRVYSEGSYSFDTSCSSTADYDAATPVTDCGGTNPITMTVGPGQIGAHILFDWGKPTTDTTCGVANCDIDVVNVWDQNAAWDRLGNTGTANKLFLGAAGVAPEEDAIWLLVSTDVNGDTYNGSPMVDGPFQGFYANFNAFAILPPGSTPGSVNNVFVEPVPNSQQETKLGSKPLASLNLYALLTILLTLFGLRLARKR